MPRYPDLSDRLKVLKGSVFEKYLDMMQRKGSELVRLHIGDAYLHPPYSLPVDPEFREQHPLFNRYCNTMGIAELRRALAEKVQQDNALPAGEAEIMLTCGASNALNVSMQSIINPGEEVLVLTPCWPFFSGMVRAMGGIVRETPFYTRLYEQPDLDIAACLGEKLTAGTVAIYLNSPNNPSGKVLNRSQLEAVADFARQHRLWLISDEAYDGMVFNDHEHISPGSLPDMFPQTLSIFTFSKVFMFAGLRLGYLAAPHETLRQFNKALVHTLYSPSTLAQLMMVAPVLERRKWQHDFVQKCHHLRGIISEGLQVPHTVPEGAYYLFFDMKPLLKGRQYWDIVEACLDAGVSIAPGEDFGEDYHSYIRLCFAGETPERLLLAVERLNQVFA